MQQKHKRLVEKHEDDCPFPHKHNKNTTRRKQNEMPKKKNAELNSENSVAR